MSTNTFIDSARITANGQVTIPKDICDVLGVSNGDRITFIVNDLEVKIANSAVYAMQELQKAMAGEAERVGIKSEDDVVALVKEIRAENHENIY